MDNILVYTHMIEYHQEVVTQVLDILQKHQLYLKSEKCLFECPSVEYLLEYKQEAGMTSGSGLQHSTYFPLFYFFIFIPTWKYMYGSVWSQTHPTVI